MTYRIPDPGEPDVLELRRGTNIVFEAMRAGAVDPNMLPSIFVRCLVVDLLAPPRRTIDAKLAQIDDMAAYMRAAVSADHMVTEFFGSER